MDGKRYSQLARIAGITIAGVGRYGQGLMPNDDLVVQQDDRMHAMYPTARTTEIEALLATGPGGLMRVVIAGAGKVGRSIAKELLANGHDIHLIDRHPEAARHSIPGSP